MRDWRKEKVGVRRSRPARHVLDIRLLHVSACADLDLQLSHQRSAGAALSGNRSGAACRSTPTAARSNGSISGSSGSRCGSGAIATAICLVLGFPLAMGDRLRARALEESPAAAGRAAVLDQPADPDLCLDRHPAHQRVCEHDLGMVLRPASPGCWMRSAFSDALPPFQPIGAALQSAGGHRRAGLCQSAVPRPAALRDA